MSTDRGGIFNEFSMTAWHNRKGRKARSPPLPPASHVDSWESTHVMALIITGAISLISSRCCSSLSCALRQTHCFLSLTHANKYSRDSRLSRAFFRPGLFLNLCTLMVYYYHHYYYYICMLVILLCCDALT